MERIDERIPGVDLPLMSVSQTRGVIRRSELTDAPRRAESLDAYKICRKNDVVFNKMSIRSGAMGIANEDGLVTYHYEVMRPRPGTDSRYVVYLMKSDWFTGELIARERGIGAGDQSNVRTTEVPFSVLRTIDAFIPDPGMQRAIADYLDRETAQTDTLIEEQQRLIEVLRERRGAIRDRHFFGIEGKRQTTIKRVLRPLSRPAAPGLGVVTAYRDGAVTLRSNRRDEGYTFSASEKGYQEIRPGDLVFHALDGFAGAVGISDSHGNATPVYHVCEVITDDDPAYVAMLLRYLGVSGFLETQAPNVRQRSVDFRNWATFARVPLALPAVDMQRAVVAEVGEQTTEIDTLIAETERFIEFARERRSALITAAVTGQIDVQNEVA
jgi:type I restriction enzyme S subunit